MLVVYGGSLHATNRYPIASASLEKHLRAWIQRHPSLYTKRYLAFTHYSPLLYTRTAILSLPLLTVLVTLPQSSLFRYYIAFSLLRVSPWYCGSIARTAHTDRVGCWTSQLHTRTHSLKIDLHYSDSAFGCSVLESGCLLLGGKYTSQT